MTDYYTISDLGRVEAKLDRVEAKLDKLLHQGDPIVLPPPDPDVCPHLVCVDGRCHACGQMTDTPECPHYAVLNGLCLGCGAAS